VEPVDDQENKVTDYDAHNDVQHSPPVLQPEEELPIAHRRSKRGCGPPVCLIEECNVTYYALSCVEQVENTHKPAIYSEAIDCGDREK
jgi:hypothetical protein